MKRPVHIKRLNGFVFLLLAGAMLLSLAACGKEEAAAPNPYEGMVQVSNGAGGMMWVKLLEGLEASDFDPEDFSHAGKFIDYTGSEYAAIRGIDVSSHQGGIDWELVAADGVEFAMIRAGYRGYTEGGLYEDEKFRENIQGALAAGLRVGVYFFSQAVNEDEALEEAEFVLDLIEGYDVTLPVAFDWEEIEDEARTSGLDGNTITDCCLAFCRAVEEAGYESAVYFYRRLGYFEYDLERLKDLKFWVGALGDSPDFYYQHHIWQYSITGQISGIEGDVDLDLYFKKIEPPTGE
ncbi:MAG: glycoside hydrolase family 25 protein [Oscillospiraceae bacterium]|jgi:lysozyme